MRNTCIDRQARENHNAQVFFMNEWRSKLKLSPNPLRGEAGYVFNKSFSIFSLICPNTLIKNS